ncbi:hypothetical protein MD484_g8560, partial [Candolleomyces efflorescens]
MPAVLSILLLPPEVLSVIFYWTVCDLQPHVPHSVRSQAYDLLSISHTSRYFRRVALDDPLLWSFVPFMTGCHEDFFAAILRRASPIPLHLQIVENAQLHQRPNNRTWSLLVRNRSNIGFLSLHVAHGVSGCLAKWLLSTRAPELRECVVMFHGAQPVSLNLQNFNNGCVFDNYAPVLKTLDLVNCHLPPNHARFPQLSTFSIRNTCIVDPTESLARLEDLHLWKPSFSGLRSLVLFTAFATPPIDISNRVALELPLLSSLMVIANATVCHQLANMLRFPSNCDRIITVQLPRGRKSTRRDAEEAAMAAASFIPKGIVYSRSWIVMHPKLHTIRFMKETQLIVMKFDLAHLEVMRGPPLVLHLMRSNLPALASSPFLSRDLFLGNIWRKMAELLSDAGVLEMVTSLNLDFHPLDPYGPVTAYPLMYGMQNVLSIGALESTHVWANPLFSWTLVSGDVFPKLQTIVVRLQEEELDMSARKCLSTYLFNRQLVHPIPKVLFSVAPALRQQLGYAFPDAIRICLRQITQDFPKSIMIDWIVAAN